MGGPKPRTRGHGDSNVIRCPVLCHHLAAAQVLFLSLLFVIELEFLKSQGEPVNFILIDCSCAVSLLTVTTAAYVRVFHVKFA